MTRVTQKHLEQTLMQQGYSLLESSDARDLLMAQGSVSDWAAFAGSWDHLEVDGYMADHGRYRRRRHANFTVRAGSLSRAAHAPHFQGVEYNAVNGGIKRWYTPIDDAIAAGPSMVSILKWCQQSFGAQRSEQTDWDIEVHQFRIEASMGHAGLPTPEGMHRDGVDYVLVLLIERRNVESGITSIGDASGALGSFTLSQTFDAVMLDDHRVYHGVTAIVPVDPQLPAFRDVLVVTFRAASAPRDPI
jgi:hypothetical protein